MCIYAYMCDTCIDVYICIHDTCNAVYICIHDTSIDVYICIHVWHMHWCIYMYTWIIDVCTCIHECMNIRKFEYVFLCENLPHQWTCYSYIPLPVTRAFMYMYVYRNTWMYVILNTFLCVKVFLIHGLAIRIPAPCWRHVYVYICIHMYTWIHRYMWIWIYVYVWKSPPSKGLLQGGEDS